MTFQRILTGYLDRWIRRPKSLLLWGPRQVGKTTLIENWLEKGLPRGWESHAYPLQDPSVRRRMEQEPGILQEELLAGSGKQKAIFIDEVQKVPALLDLVQFLIDRHKSKWKFILTGSSARKIRRAGANLLPGRVFEKRLDPLMWSELGWPHPSPGRSSTPLPWPKIREAGKVGGKTPRFGLEDQMTWGSLPEMPALGEADRSETLKSYVSLYIEQEIRAEALARNLGAFNRFLELAARESGSAPNLSKLAQESGVSMPAIKGYYAILEDTFLVERLEPYLKNARKRLMATPRHFFFDTGVRNAAAGLPLTRDILAVESGRLFEHHIILETLRRIRSMDLPWKVHYWRTSHGAEVDMVVDTGDELVPIEIKYSTHVSRSDLSGLHQFMEDYRSKVRQGWLVCRIPKPRKLARQITAIPWQML